MALIILSNVGPWDTDQLGVVDTCNSIPGFIKYIKDLNLPAVEMITSNFEFEVNLWVEECAIVSFPYRGSPIYAAKIEVNPHCTNMYFVVDTDR